MATAPAPSRGEIWLVNFAFACAYATSLLINSARAAEPEPAKSPDIPALIVGGEQAPKSFVVDGVMRFSADAGLAFHVATDGAKQRCAVYDPFDGTPILLSDRQQTLMYDLAKGRIVRLTSSRANVRVDWDAGKEKPLTFELKVDRVTDPKRLDALNCWFRIDRFVKASGTELKRLDGPADPELFGAQRPNGNIGSVQCSRNDPSWFRFTSLKAGEPFYRLDLRASRISKPIPDSALAFPDVDRLGKEMELVELDPEAQLKFIQEAGRGGLWMVKLALASDPELKASVEKSMPGLGLDALRARDKELGGRYRAALEAQGIRFSAQPATAKTAPDR